MLQYTLQSSQCLSAILTKVILMKLIVDVVVLMNHRLLDVVFLHTVRQLQLQVGVSQDHLEVLQTLLEQATN